MTKQVAVLGCGLMGSSLARALHRAGYNVVVWNRTHERAERLAESGMTAVRTVTEAVVAADLTLICVASYGAVDGMLDELDTHLFKGRPVVNLTTGTPAEARKTSTLFVKRGTPYLDGAIIAYPQDMGLADTMVLYSGEFETWKKCEAVLNHLGDASCHVGDEVGGANVLDAAMSGAFYCVSLGAFVEGASYAVSQGVAPEQLLPVSNVLSKLLVRSVAEVVDAIRSGDHASDQATLFAFEEGCTHWRDAVIEGGQNATLIRALVESLQRANASGHGDQGISALIETSSLD